MRNFRDMSKAWHDFLENGSRHSLEQSSQGTPSVAEVIRARRETSLREFRQHSYNSVQIATEQTSSISRTYVTKDDFLKVQTLLHTSTRHLSFKSHEQRLSIALSCFSECDILSVIPTGGGKTLVFFLYAVLRRREGCEDILFKGWIIDGRV